MASYGRLKVAEPPKGNGLTSRNAQGAARAPAQPGRVIVKLEDDDIRAPIFGMGRVVSISRRIRILVITTTNLHDSERLAPVLKHVNCVGKSVDEGHGGHCGCP